MGPAAPVPGPRAPPHTQNPPLFPLNPCQDPLQGEELGLRLPGGKPGRIWRGWLRESRHSRLRATLPPAPSQHREQTNFPDFPGAGWGAPAVSSSTSTRKGALPSKTLALPCLFSELSEFSLGRGGGSPWITGQKAPAPGGLCLGDLLASTQIPAAERAPAAPASWPLLPLTLRDSFGWRFGSSMAQAPQRLLPQHTYAARSEARTGNKAALLPPHLLPFPPHFLHIPHAPTKSQLCPTHAVHRRKGTSCVLPLKSPSRARTGNSAWTC